MHPKKLVRELKRLQGLEKEHKLLQEEHELLKEASAHGVAVLADNAHAESSFHSMKADMLHGTAFANDQALLRGIAVRALLQLPAPVLLIGLLRRRAGAPAPSCTNADRRRA